MDYRESERTVEDAGSNSGRGSQGSKRPAKALFSEHYLRKRMGDHGEWALDASDPFAKMKTLYEEKRGILSELSEVQTEDEFIRPALKNLGFAYIPQTRVDVAGRARWPDYTLFRDRTAQEDAYPLQQDHVAFYARALAVCEAKFWGRPLNKILADDPRDIVRNTNPSFQMVMYLFGTRVDWGILTNGAVWRLYYREASSTATEFYEVDLVELLEADDPKPFKYFWLFFRRDAFIKDAQGRNFLERVREGSATYARVVGDRLRGLVFDEVFPLLSGGFVSCAAEREEDATSEDARALIYEASLSLLYKLLFLLYAEARNLLPMDNPGYRSQSATQLARDVARRLDREEPFGRTSTGLYDRLLNLCRMVDQGDRNLALPRYNGGLFHFDFTDPADRQENSANWYLTQHRVSDDALAHALDRLARIDGEPIDYGFIGVRHLGAIYEGLLEYTLIVDDASNGQVHLQTGKAERKATGSYYTPGYVVQYIIRQSLGPVLQERAERFGALMEQIVEVRKQLGDGRRGPGSIGTLRTRLEQLEHEARQALLDIKVCDPAMGSGHFLVEAVDFLTDGLVDILNQHPEHNPVLAMLEHIRQDIEVSLADQGIPIDAARLDDTQLLQRVVMKRCIYGVDLNSMAVELAKVSLWLHSFTVGAPLSFLDHHLRRGNSLIGATAREAQEQLSGELPMFGGPFAGLLRAAEIMRGITLLSDATFAEVEESERLFRRFDEAAKPYKQLLDIYVARHFGLKHADEFLRLYGAETIQAGRETVGEPYRTALRETRRLYEAKRFFHWDLEFPEVFIDLGRATWKLDPGFDAVVGNPPWGAPDRSMEFWTGSGFYSLAQGQFDYWDLFLQRALALCRHGGRHSFVVPDSIVQPEHRSARAQLLDASVPSGLVRIGEGSFESVFRAAFIYCTTRGKASEPDQIRTLQLNRAQRDLLEQGKASIESLMCEYGEPAPVSWFSRVREYEFELGVSASDREIMLQMEKFAIDWDEVCWDGRGVELGKEGLVVRCSECRKWMPQPTRLQDARYDTVSCKHCRANLKNQKRLGHARIVGSEPVNELWRPFIVGQAVNRYHTSDLLYIDTSYDGIQYKEDGFYTPPKLLVRKTGVGIYATIDQSSALTNQVVFIFRKLDQLPAELASISLEYVLGLLSSRAMLYYYVQRFGEREWRSYPYVTQAIIKKLPIPSPYEAGPQAIQTHDRLTDLVRAALHACGPISRSLDIEIEEAAMKAFGLPASASERIHDVLNKMQKLRIVRELLHE